MTHRRGKKEPRPKRAPVPGCKLWLDPFHIVVRDGSLVVFEHDDVLGDDRPVLTVIEGQPRAHWPRGEIVPKLSRALYECWDLIEDAGFVPSHGRMTPHPMFLACVACGAQPFERCRDGVGDVLEREHIVRVDFWPIPNTRGWESMSEIGKIQVATAETARR